ncbi:hypothetical protein Tco_0995239 [Tanacetum coccineum]
MGRILEARDHKEDKAKDESETYLRRQNSILVDMTTKEEEIDVFILLNNRYVLYSLQSKQTRKGKLEKIDRQSERSFQKLVPVLFPTRNLLRLEMRLTHLTLRELTSVMMELNVELKAAERT